MKILLNVPYAEKDAAKLKRAKWDPNIKSWYIDDITKVRSVERWIPPHNIICENLYLLKMQHKCWKCGQEISVIMLATDRSYSPEENYRKSANLQLLTYVKSMPDALKGFLQQYLYYPSFSRTIKETYFVNHCPYCKSISGDNFLHEIPAQAFYKKIFYKNSDSITYARILNSVCILLQATLPYYDEMSSSFDLVQEHLVTGQENRASLMVTQKEINKLFGCSIRAADITIPGL